MSELTLASVSNQLGDAVERIGASVVQVQGHRRPASGVVYAAEAVVTTARAIGREEHPRVRTPDGRQLQAEIAGWDPATHLAVLRVAELAVPAAEVSDTTPRAGHLALAVGRSWSNGLTASLGVVSIIGGPLPTGRGLAIPEIIRTSAQMHGGFSGGAFADGSGRLIGICTAAEIRGLAVVIPIGIAWRAAGDLLQHGRRPRGHLGVAGQPVRLAPKQSGPDGPDSGRAPRGGRRREPGRCCRPARRRCAGRARWPRHPVAGGTAPGPRAGSRGPRGHRSRHSRRRGAGVDRDDRRTAIAGPAVHDL